MTNEEKYIHCYLGEHLHLTNFAFDQVISLLKKGNIDIGEDKEKLIELLEDAKLDEFEVWCKKEGLEVEDSSFALPDPGKATYSDGPEYGGDEDQGSVMSLIDSRDWTEETGDDTVS